MLGFLIDIISPSLFHAHKTSVLILTFVQIFITVEDAQITPTREINTFLVVRSKTNQLENITTFLSSALNLSRSIAITGRA